MGRTVAVTGIGVVSPAGCDLESFWSFVVAGKSAARRIERFDPEGLRVNFGAEVREWTPTDFLTPKECRRLDRFAQFGVGAAELAVADAGITGVDPHRGAVIAGCGFGGAESLDALGASGQLGRPEIRSRPTLLPRTMLNAASAVIGMSLGWRGPNLTLSTVCAAGAHAIGEGVRLLREGSADVVVAGGTDAAITPFAVNGFEALGALSTRSADPESASRPFDRDRDGFVLGEGAAFLVLEREEDAKARGVRAYALVVGYGRNADAHHLVMPEPNGSGARACMEQALVDADVSAEDVVHVNAHGTSTPLNDAAESTAIMAALKQRPVPVTSLKGAIGHLMGAAGAVEAAAACLTLAHGEIPPVANTDVVDPDIEVDVVTGVSRPIRAGAVISNSFAFGGQNASLVFLPA